MQFFATEWFVWLAVNVLVPILIPILIFAAFARFGKGNLLDSFTRSGALLFYSITLIIDMVGDSYSFGGDADTPTEQGAENVGAPVGEVVATAPGSGARPALGDPEQAVIAVVGMAAILLFAALYAFLDLEHDNLTEDKDKRAARIITIMSVFIAAGLVLGFRVTNSMW